MVNNRNPGYNGPRNNSYSQPAPEIVRPEPLPEDYVTVAEDAIRALKEKGGKIITTSKLRSLFSLFAETFNAISRNDQEKLTKAQINALRAARVRIYYEIGREDGYRGNPDYVAVGRFVRQTRLLEYLEGIGDSCEALMRFYHYMEALVAFHRYYFGELKDRN